MSLTEALAEQGIRVVHLDDHLIVVDKPSGMPSQGTRDGPAGVIDLVQRTEPDATLPHRLDQPASGLLVIARSERAASPLAAVFREHRATRVYRVVLAGVLSAPVTWGAELDGKHARTQVIRAVRASGFSAVEIRLETGRTHQIRRHAALAGHAVVGDRRHGGEMGRAWPRLALHAAALQLVHPVSGEELAWTAPVPEDLAGLGRVAGGEGV